MFMELFKMGYITIPLVGKNPASGVKDWGIWATDGIPESEVERFEKHYPVGKFGIGLVSGPASNNIIIVDCDSVDEKIHALVPKSPLSRFGQRGFGNIYVNKFNIESCSFERPNQNMHRDPTGKPIEGIEVRGRGLYLAIPPTVHPITDKPYTWLTEHRIEMFNSEYLPPLLLEDVNGFEDFFNHDSHKGINLTGVFVHPNTERCPHDSHNRLKAMASGFISGCVPIEKAISDLLRYDEDHHKPIGYFKDKSRSECKSDPYSNAAKFYSNILNSHNRVRTRKGLPPEVPSEATRVTIDLSTIARKTTPAAFPELPGLLNSVKSAVLRVSRSRQEELSTGAAIAICSALASNRFHLEGRPAITHQYILNVARSGQGKGAGFQVATSLFGPGALERYNLIGLRNYSSNASFVNDLPLQRSRLDMIDEFGTVLRGFAGGSDIKKETENLLCELYTADGGYWGGHKTATSGAKGACYAPGVTIYGNIQEEILVNTASSSMISSGFLSRFLFFSADDAAPFNRRYRESMDMEPIAKECERLFPWFKFESILPDGSVISDPGKVEPNRMPLSWGNGVFDYKTDIDEDMYRRELELEKSGDQIGAIFLSRHLQIAERLAITMAICCDRREVTKEDIDCALAVVRAATARASGYLRGIGGEAPGEKKMRWAVRALTKKSVIGHREMLKGSHMDAQAFKKMMDTLEQSNQVVAFIDAKHGGIHYKLP